MRVELSVLSSLVVAMALLSGHCCSGGQVILRAPENQTVDVGGNATFVCVADSTVRTIFDVLLVVGFKNGETLAIRRGTATQQLAERGMSVLASPKFFEIGVTINGRKINNETIVSCKVVYSKTEMSPPAVLIVKGPPSGNDVETNNAISVSFVRSWNSVIEGGSVEACFTVTGSVTERGDNTFTITSDSTGAASSLVSVDVPISRTGVTCHTITGIVTDNMAVDPEGRAGFTLHIQSDNPAISCVESCTADYIIIDDDIVYLEFADPAYTAREGGDLQQVCVELVAAESITIQRPVAFRVQATGGTAEGGEDFSARALRPQIGYFNIGARNGDRWCLPVPITDDSIAEEEVFSVNLFVSDVQVVAVQTSVEVTITDNDIETS